MDYFLDRITQEPFLADIFEYINVSLTGKSNMKKMINKFGEVVLCLGRLDEKLEPIKDKLKSIDQQGRRNSGRSMMSKSGMGDNDAMSCLSGIMDHVNSRVRDQKNKMKKMKNEESTLQISPDVSLLKFTGLSPRGMRLAGPRKSDFAATLTANFSSEVAKYETGVKINELSGEGSGSESETENKSRYSAIDDRKKKTTKNSWNKVDSDAKTHAHFGKTLKPQEMLSPGFKLFTHELGIINYYYVFRTQTGSFLDNSMNNLTKIKL